MSGRNLTTLTGEIRGEIRLRENKCRFMLQVEGSLFVIEAPGREQMTICKALAEEDEVYIIATPRSYLHRKCRQHHVYFEALTVIPLDRKGELQGLTSILTREALYRNGNG